MKNKKIAALILASAISVSSFVPAFAAPVTMPDGVVFDPAYYAQNNPDVVAAFGTDTNPLYYHYSVCGKNEGRLAADPAAAEQYVQAQTASVTAAQASEATRNAILALKTTYPEGLSWSDETSRYYSPAWNLVGAGCVAFAMTVSDAVYGAGAKVNNFYDQTPDTLQVGDVVKYVTPNGNTHWIVVTDTSGTSITICEGNYSHKVHWGRTLTKVSMTGKILRVVRRG